MSAQQSTEVVAAAAASNSFSRTTNTINDNNSVISKNKKQTAPTLNNLEMESIESVSSSTQREAQMTITGDPSDNRIVAGSRNPSLLARLCSCLNVLRLRRSKRYLNTTASSMDQSMVITEFSEGGASTAEPVRIPERCAEDKNRKTLVLDLDETLVTSSCLEFSHADLKIKIQLQGGLEKNVWMKFRPGVKRFLNELSETFEIIIFTASIKEYANVVIDFLDTENVVDFRVFRENCSLDQSTGNLYKDLSLLKRNMNEIIIVDNQANQFKKQPENGLQIADFKIDGKNDRALMDLLPFLKLLSGFQDVRPVSAHWKAYMDCEQIRYVDINGMDCEFTRGAVDLYEDDRLKTEMSESRIDEIDLEQMKEECDVGGNSNGSDGNGSVIVIENNKLSASTASQNKKSAGGDFDRHMRSASQRMSGILQPIEVRRNSNVNNQEVIASSISSRISTKAVVGEKKHNNGNSKSLFDFTGFKSSIYNKIRVSENVNGGAALGGKENASQTNGGSVPSRKQSKQLMVATNDGKKENKIGYMEIQETLGEQNSTTIANKENITNLFDTSASQNDQSDTFIKKPRVYTKPHSRRCASQQIRFATVSLKDEQFNSPMAKEI